MSLFQKSVLNKYLQTLDTKELEKSFQKFNQFYGDQERLENIKLLKEENYQEGFLREIFVDVLGYTINPNKNYNLTTEFKNETDSKKADGAILLDSKAIGVIELKSTKTTDMESIIDQAFNYKNHQSGCKYVITSNFEKLRFYIDNATEFEEFYLFDLDFERFKIFYLLLSCEKLLNNIPAMIKKESQLHEENISDKLYKDYSEFKYKIYRNLIKNNPQYDKILLFKKSQKLLDRILFILFAEDSGLVPPNAISEIIKQWQTLIDLDEKQPLYSRFVKFFHHLDIGHKYSKFELPAYNGGLFKKDDVLDNVSIDDEVLLNDALKLSSYDYSTEVDVNILGHIFEHSITEIEEITAELEGTEKDSSKSKRKKEGVFYTPKYITKYIVENTIGELCNSKKKELNLDEIDEEILENSRTVKGKLTKKAETLFNNLQTYREYILSLKILDPACGSGAFLNQALDFLIEEHKWIDEQRSRLLKESFVIVEFEKDILEQNLYGVDINEEAVEIAKLSLWLRTARKGRKLSDLSSNIKCGNSLIDDPEVAGDKAFNWEKEFPEIMKNGGFDVVIGNPPYVRQELLSEIKHFLRNNYESYNSIADLYIYFIEKAIKLLKEKGEISFIIPNKFIRANYGAELRKFLVKSIRIIKIINFEDYPVFDNVSTYPIILVMKNENKFSDFYYGAINKKIDDDPIYFLEKNGFTASAQSVIENDWQIVNKNSQSILRKIRSNSISLRKIVDDKIFRGVSTGRNDVFIIDESRRNELVSKSKDASKIIKKILLGKEVKRYTINFENMYLLFIPWEFDINCDIAIKEYLELNRENLLSRPEVKEGRFNWWCLSRYGSKNAIYLHQPKIIYPRINKECNFCIDKTGEYSLSDNNFFIASDSKTLLAVLNSKLIFFYLKNVCSSLQGGYYDFRRPYIESIPISRSIEFENDQLTNKTDLISNYSVERDLLKKRFINRVQSNFNIEKVTGNLETFYSFDIVAFFSELKKKKITLSLKEQDEWEEYFNENKQKILELQHQIDQTDREIDQLVYELYGLTEEEIKIVEESTN